MFLYRQEIDGKYKTGRTSDKISIRKGEAKVHVGDLAVGGRFQVTENIFGAAKFCEIPVYSYSAGFTPIISYLQTMAQHTVECAFGLKNCRCLSAQA